MKTNLFPFPAITAENCPAAKSFIHEYEFSRWKLVNYVKAVAFLPTQGIMPTDTSIGKTARGNVQKHCTRVQMLKMMALGLVTEDQHTKLGYSYRLTGAGIKALEKIQKIEADWAKAHPSRLYGAAPVKVSLKMEAAALRAQVALLESENASILRENQALKDSLNLLMSVTPSKP